MIRAMTLRAGSVAILGVLATIPAPLPAARNPLLGRWRVVPRPGAAKKDDLSQLFKGGRVELDVPLGRLVLQEVAAQNQALESYSARK